MSLDKDTEPGTVTVTCKRSASKSRDVSNSRAGVFTDQLACLGTRISVTIGSHNRLYIKGPQRIVSDRASGISRGGVKEDESLEVKPSLVDDLAQDM